MWLVKSRTVSTQHRIKNDSNKQNGIVASILLSSIVIN